MPTSRELSNACLVLCYGAAALAAQVLFLRELLVLGQGNELLLGLGLWAWLVWTGLGSLWGGRLAASRSVSTVTLALVLGGLGWLLPATVLVIRAFPSLFDLPTGQVLPLFQAGLLFLAVLAPFCIVSGLFFPLACQSFRESPNRGLVGWVYFLDTLGAALGVGILQLFLIGRYPSLGLALGLGLILTQVSLLSPDVRRAKSGWAMSGVSFLVLGGLLLQEARLEKGSRHWQWPAHTLVAVQESPYGLLSATREARQFSFFENNLWYFSYPDPFHAESRVQYALLQHPHPRRVLLIGGGVGGGVAEILKTPTLTALDYVELDPRLISLVQDVLPPKATRALQDPRVRLVYQDGRRFVKQTATTYDVILLCLPEPKNALLNRFYSQEFFQEIKQCLHPAGVFSFGLTGAEVSLSPLRAQYLALEYHTLKQVFAEVLVFPGHTARFFASPTPGTLITDPATLMARLKARRLQLFYVREYYLFHELSPARRAYWQQILAQTDAGVNTDLSPQCYYYDLTLSWAEESSMLKDLFLRLRALPFWIIPCGLGLLTLALWRLWQRPGARRRGPYLYNVLVMGLGTMAMELTIIILFQIQIGFLYGQIGMLLAAFMLGMAVGSGLTPRLFSTRGRAWHLALGFQAGLALLAALLALGLPTLARFPLLNWEGWAQGFLALLLGGVGLLGGGLFASQAELLRETGTRLAISAGLLYAVDLVGATIGTLGMSLVALPLWGLRQTLFFVALLHGSALVILAPGRPLTAPGSGPDSSRQKIFS